MRRSVCLVIFCVVAGIVVQIGMGQCAEVSKSQTMSAQGSGAQLEDKHDALQPEYSDVVNLEPVFSVPEVQPHFIQANKIVYRPDLVEYAQVKVIFDYSLWNKLSLVDNRQCIAQLMAQDGHGIVVLELVSAFGEYDSAKDTSVYLGPFQYIPPDVCSDPRQLEAFIGEVRTQKEPWSNVKTLMEWFKTNIKPDVDSPNVSVDMVLDTKVGNIVGIVDAFVTLSRFLGIPTKYVVGAGHLNGRFFQDMWVEVWLGNSWVAIDPARGDLYPNALMIKLGEAASLRDAIVQLERIWSGIDIEILDYVKGIIKGRYGWKLIPGVSRGKYTNADMGFEIGFDEDTWIVQNIKLGELDALYFSCVQEPGVFVRMEFLDVDVGITCDRFHAEIVNHFLSTNASVKEIGYTSELQLNSMWEGRQTHFVLEDADSKRAVVTTILTPGRLFIFLLMEDNVSLLKYENDLNYMIRSLTLF
jgi:hypothetical protein